MNNERGVYYKELSNWKDFLGIWVKVDKTWKQVRYIFNKIEGAYTCVYSGLDEKILSLFKETPEIHPHEKGSFEDNYNGYILRIHDSLTSGSLITGGSSSHSDHGYSSAKTTSTNYHTKDGDKINIGKGRITTTTSHNHSLNSHHHTATPSNIPPYINVEAYKEMTVVYKGFLILSDFEVTSPEWEEVTEELHDKFLRVDNENVGGTGGHSTHSHGIVDVTVASKTFGSGYNTAQDYGWHQTHYHKFNHNSTYPNDPYHYTFRVYRAKYDEAIIPKDTYVFLHHTAESYPDGFEQSAFSVRFVKIMRSGIGTGGGSNPYHRHYDNSGIQSYVGSNTKYFRNWSKEYYTVKTHSHTLSSYYHYHSTYRDSTPPYVELPLVKKVVDY